MGRALAALALLLLCAGVAEACPSCITGVDSREVDHLFNGLYLSTALMMSLPFVVVGSVVYNLRKALLEDEELLEEGAQNPARSDR